MRLAAQRSCAGPADEVRARLHAQTRWSQWAPGELTVTSDADERPALAVWEWTGPVPVHVTLEISREPDGISFRQVEGDLDALDGRIEIHPGDDGPMLVAQVHLQPPLRVTTVLREELQLGMVACLGRVAADVCAAPGSAR